MGWPRPLRLRPSDATNIASDTTEGGRQYLPDISKEWTDGIQDDCHDPLWSRPRDYICNTEVLKRAWSVSEMTAGRLLYMRYSASSNVRIPLEWEFVCSEVLTSPVAQAPSFAFPTSPMGYWGHKPHYERRDTDAGDTCYDGLDR